jgi:hypothetical protein
VSNISAVIEKVKKLQRLANGSSNPNEAATAAAAANKLIDQHRLEQSEINSETEEDIFEDDDSVYESGRITQWKSSLVCALAKHYGCAIFNSKTYRSNKYKLVGRKSDVEVVKYMFAWLCLEIDRLSDRASKEKHLDRSAGKIFSNSFCVGAVTGVREQLEKSRKEVVQNYSGDSSAIVKLNNRANEAEEWLRNAHRLKSSGNRSKAYLDSRAYDAGKISGSNIHLGAGLNAAKGVRLIGS